MNKKKISEFKRLVEKEEKILIIVHRSPDGDALGSMLGLYHYLTSIGKSVDMWVPDAFPRFFDWLPGIEKVRVFEENMDAGKEAFANADLIFCLDFNSFSRTGKAARFISASKSRKIMIDHHRDPDMTFTLRMYNIEASSTCELVYEIINGLGDRPSKKTAESLFCGLITDTGSFKYSTSKRTLEIAGALLDAGVDNSLIHNKIANIKSVDNLRLRGFALSEKLVYIPDSHAGYIALSLENLEHFNYQKGDTEGLVNEILSISGVKLAILFSEGIDEVRISFRSIGDFDVNEIAKKYFGGGGHKNAAGARSKQSLLDTEKIIVDIINENKSKLA